MENGRRWTVRYRHVENVSHPETFKTLLCVMYELVCTTKMVDEYSQYTNRIMHMHTSYELVVCICIILECILH